MTEKDATSSAHRAATAMPEEAPVPEQWRDVDIHALTWHRPYTSVDDVDNKTSPHRKKKNSKSPQRRPPSAGIRGWGDEDFDADKLLVDPFDRAVRRKEEQPIDDHGTDGRRERERDRKRLNCSSTTPETRAEGMTDTELAGRAATALAGPASMAGSPVRTSFSTASSSRKEMEAQHKKMLLLQRQQQLREQQAQPPQETQALQPRSLVAVDFVPTDSMTTTSDTPMRTMQRKPNALKSFRKKPPSGGGPAPRPTTTATTPHLPKLRDTAKPNKRTTLPLFGLHLEDTQQLRAIVFGQLETLWSLMASRSGGTMSSSSSIKTKSAFECSMLLSKLCKCVGTVMGPTSASSAASLQFYQSQAKEMEFESFGEFLIRHAIQPAFHHFERDTSVETYVMTLESVVQSLLINDALDASNPRWRIRELNEIEPVFPHWKNPTDSPRPKTRSAAAMEAPPEQQEEMLEEELAQVEGLIRSYSRDLIAMNPTEPHQEAKIIHQTNIQRRVQLRQSWNTTSGKASNQEPTTTTSASTEAVKAAFQVQSIVPPGHVAKGLAFNHWHTTPDQQEQAFSDQMEDDGDRQVVVCGACTTAKAELWCASCFAVYCPSCWTNAHQSTVDMSCVHQHIMAPSTRSLLQEKDDELRPPVSMLYLPTKPLVVGKLWRSKPASRKPRRDPLIPDTTTITLVSQPILPALVPRAQKPTVHERQREHHQSPLSSDTTDSTANLLKTLLLKTGTISTTASPATNASSVSSTSSFQRYLIKAQREQLPTSSVVFNANELLADADKGKGG